MLGRVTGRYENNHCYLWWMNTPFARLGNIPAVEDGRGSSIDREALYYRPRGSILDREAHRKQVQHHQAACLHEQGTRHRHSGDPVHDCRQASHNQLLTIWVSPEQEAWSSYQLPHLFKSSWNGRWSKSSEQPETEWWRVDVARYKIINIYNVHPRRSHLRPSRRSHTPVCVLATLTASGVIAHLLTVIALTPGQQPTNLGC